jgi:lambda family phage portal protein
LTFLDRVISTISPRTALQRAQARVALEALAHYRAATIPQRSANVRAVSGDADAVAINARRQIMQSARDVVRNNGLAERAATVLVNSIVGTGIEPKLVSNDKALQDEWKAHLRLLNSTQIDAEGLSTLAAIQRLAVRAMVVDGESLVVWMDDPSRDGFFKVRVLEADYLDDRLNGRAADGLNTIYDGIEYDERNRVVAYHIYDEHPGSAVWHANWRGLTSSRVEASRVLHLYRVDRPGQRRGVSWFAPVLSDLVALADNDEAQLMRQKIAACMVAFWRSDKTPDDA